MVKLWKLKLNFYGIPQDLQAPKFLGILCIDGVTSTSYRSESKTRMKKKKEKEKKKLKNKWSAQSNDLKF